MKKGKPKQPPIYRALERLLSWAVPVVDSLPKSLACQTLGGLLIRDMRDSLTYVMTATEAEDVNAKIECIKLLAVNLTNIRTTMRVFTENRSISLKKEAEFLDLVNAVTTQQNAWLQKWETKAVADLP